MLVDILIMCYALLMTLLIFKAEKLPQNSFKVILIGLFLTPIIGYIYLNKYQVQMKESSIN